MRINFKKVFLLAIVAMATISQTTLADSGKLTGKQKKARQIFSEARLLSDEHEKIKELKEAIEMDREFVEAYWLLSQTYENMHDEVNMIVYLERVAQPQYDKYDKTEDRLGKAYYSIGQYAKAKECFNKNTGKNTDWIKKCDDAIELKNHPILFKPTNLVRVNTDYDDYWPSITADGKEISTTVNVGQREGANNINAQEDIYHSYLGENGEWSKSEPLGPPTNTNQNEGAQNFSVDGRYMFFIACDRVGGEGGCDIYYSIRRGNMWSPAINPGKPLNSRYWETTPSFSPAGDELFFSSSRPGGKGGKDIWVSKVTILENGLLQFSEPKNLGAPINTNEDEVSPYIHADNKTLYFSSKGHPGLGGYDIFYSQRDSNNVWSTPKNIGYPINSHRDEIGFCVDAQGDKAYLSSNGILKNGRGKDIYQLDLPEDLRPEKMEYFDGKVWDSKTKKPIQAHIEVYKLKDNKTVFQSVSDEITGDFQAFLPVDEKYGYNIHKKGYLFVSGSFEPRDKATKRKDIGMGEIAVGEKVTLKNIFFQFDSYKLSSDSYGELNRLVNFMRQNPKVYIELGGHTDIVGKREYNINLSQQRAKEVYDYLINHGAPQSHLSYKGYGPDKPIASNKTEDGRAQNRRTEVVITKY